MSVSPLLIMQYGTFLVTMGMALNQFIKAMYSNDERSYMKRKLVNNLKSQQQRILKVDPDSTTQRLFREAGLSSVSEFRWLLIRLTLTLLPTIYFLVDREILTAVVVMTIMFFATETTLKFSPVTWFLKGRKKAIQESKETELFTLFALFKTDLMASQSEQVNVYHLVHEARPYFKKIDYVLVQFLSLWKKSPESAGAVFHKELSGETASFIGDVLSKLHNMNRTDALNLLAEQGEVFTFKRAEIANQKEEKKRLMFFIMFTLASFTGIVWFMYLTYSMVSDSMNF